MMSGPSSRQKTIHSIAYELSVEVAPARTFGRSDSDPRLGHWRCDAGSVRLGARQPDLTRGSGADC